MKRKKVVKRPGSIEVTGGDPQHAAPEESEEQKTKRLVWERKMAYARLFDTPDGKTVLEDMRLSFGDRSSFVRGDPHATSFNDGLREGYLRILHIRREVMEVGGEQERQKSYIEEVTGTDPIITGD